MSPQDAKSKPNPAPKDASKRGGLPEDGDLDVLASLANNAFSAPAGSSATATAPRGPAEPAAPPSTSRGAPAPTTPAQRAGGAATAPPPPAPPRTAPPRQAANAPEEPETGPAANDNRFTQVTSVVDVGVLARFEQYKLREKIRTNKEPSNTVVVFKAINHAVANDRLARLLAALEPEEEAPGQLLSLNAPGRRTTREKRKTDQLSWRPTFANLATIDGVWEQHGFPHRSKFVESCLGDFLPPLEQRRRGNQKS